MVQLWELLGEINLLDGKLTRDSDFSHQTRFAQMIGLLGPPPSGLLARADRDAYLSFYDYRGILDSH